MKESKEYLISDIIDTIGVLHNINKVTIAKYIGISRQLLNKKIKLNNLSKEQDNKIISLVSNPSLIFVK